MLFHLILEFENFKAFLHLFSPPPPRPETETNGDDVTMTSRRRHISSRFDFTIHNGAYFPPTPPSPLGLGIKENRAYT